MWETPVELAPKTNLSSDGATIYTGSECGPVAALAIADGALRWRRAVSPAICQISTPIQEPAPVVHGDEVLSDEGAVRRRSDGVVTDLIAGGGRVAAAGNMRVGIEDWRLHAMDSRGRLQWITPPRTFGTSYAERPIIAGGTVFASGDHGGEIQALDLATGDVAWTDTPFTGTATLTARPGTLLAVYGEQLAAYGPAAPGPVIKLSPPESPTPQRRPALSWQADGATFTSCRIDDGPAQACMSGFAPPADLPDGEHTITVTASGFGGTTASATVVRIDTTAPDTTIVSGPPPYDRGNLVHPLKWEVDEVGVGIECRLDGVLVSTDCEEDTFLTFNVPDGPHELTLTAYDLTNNVEAEPAVHRWTRDSRAPHVTITRAPAARSNDATPEIEFSGDEEGLTFTCSGTPCTSPARLVDLFGPIRDGTWTITILATDRAGNVSRPGTEVTFTLDTTAPAARIDSGPPPLTNAPQAEVAFAAVEPASGLECRLDAGEWEACTSPRTVATGADGDHTFATRAVDDLGNRGAMASRTWRTDRTPPVLSLESTPAPYSNAVPHRFGLAATEPGTLTCQVDGVPRNGCVEIYDLPDGAHTISWQFADRAGNPASSVPAPHTWLVDTRRPVVTITGAPSGYTARRDVSLAIGADEDGVTLLCEEDGVPSGPCPATVIRSGLPDGNHSQHVRGTDRAGNVALVADSYWIVDATGPAASVYGSNVFPGGSAQLQFNGESDSDVYRCTVDERPDFACAPPQVEVSGLAPGEHTLVIVGTDRLGNVGPPVTLRWTQLAPNAPFVLPAPPPAAGVAPRASAPPAAVLSAAGKRRLLRDARATVRRLARRGRGIARVSTVTFASSVPLSGRVSATLRLGSRTVGKGTVMRQRTGPFRVRLKLTAAGRRALRRSGGRLDLRLRFTPSGGREASVRATATRARR